MNTRRDCPKLQSDFVLALPRALVSPGHHTFWILSLSLCLQIMNKAKSSCVYGDVWLQIIQCTFGRESPQIFNFYVDNLKKTLLHVFHYNVHYLFHHFIFPKFVL